MKRHITIICLIIIGLSAFAQDSLQVYLKIAAANNPTVIQHYKEYEAALQKVPQVGSLPDPQLEMGVFLSPMEVVNGKELADIKLMQMFPWFGELKNAKDEMRWMAQMKFEVFRDAKLQVYYEVQQSWYDLYRIHHEEMITKQNIELLKSIRRMGIVEFGAGGKKNGVSSAAKTAVNQQFYSRQTSDMKTMNRSASLAGSSASGSMSQGGMENSRNSSGLTGVYDVEMELADLENSLSTLQNEETVAIARFNALLNRTENNPVVIPDTLTSEPLSLSYLTVSDSLFTNNPMLNMLRYEQRSLKSKSIMQKKMGFPMLGLGLNYSLIAPDPMSVSAMNGRDMIMPMVTLTLPVYRKKYTAMQTETRLLKEASDENLTATRNELRISYLEALQQYYDAERRLKLFEKQQNYLQKSLQISLAEFSTGSLNLEQIQNLRRRLLEYELKQIEALTDFNISKALIMRITAIVN